MGSLEAEKHLLLPAYFLFPVSITYRWSFIPEMAFARLPEPASSGPSECLLGNQPRLRAPGHFCRPHAALSFHGSKGTCLPAVTASL